MSGFSFSTKENMNPCLIIKSLSFSELILADDETFPLDI
jgi:hypothetical protein